MNENWKWFLGFWTGVASLLIVLCAWRGGWLHFLRQPEWVTALATLGTGLVLVVTAIFALRGLTDSRKTRHAQIVIDLSREWDSLEMRESRRAFVMKTEPAVRAFFKRHYDPATKRTLAEYNADSEESGKLLLFPNLLERVGVLHDGGIVTSPVVYKLWGAPVASAWRQWALSAREIRIRQPNALRYFDKLDEDMRKYAASVGETFPARPDL